MASLRFPIANTWHTKVGMVMTPIKRTRVVASSISAYTNTPRRALHQRSTQYSTTPQTTPRFVPVPKGQSLSSPVPTSRIIPSTSRTNRASYSTAASMSKEPVVHDIFEPVTGTWQYVVVDPDTNAAAIIDPVLDYDPATQTITTHSADALVALANEAGYRVDWILETHAHADHITASSYLQDQIVQQQGHRPLIGIGKRIGQVQQLFGERYGVPAKELEGVFDKTFGDDEEFELGNLKAMAIYTPGHTPDHIGYKIGDNVFCGDSIFHADIGTARCDFPGGSAKDLYKSAHRLLQLPDQVKIWTGHDYPPDERNEPVPYLTVKEHRERNKHVKDGVSEDEFITMRQERDAALGAPRLLHQSLQMNIRGGRLPFPTPHGQRLLHLPLKINALEW